MVMVAIIVGAIIGVLVFVIKKRKRDKEDKEDF
jgi:heme/copper-type cytochrome/quinol oxidase subunit 2